MAGVDAVYDAAFQRAGMLRVSDLRGCSTAETLGQLKSPPGKRLAILTNGRGISVPQSTDWSSSAAFRRISRKA
jgi:acetyltransferase